MRDLKTEIPSLMLVKPNPERDAPFAYGWFSSDDGKETLLLMGNAEKKIKPSSIESEMQTLNKFLQLEKDRKQITWMMRYGDKTIGAVWIELVDTPEVKAPAVHIMIGDKSYRGNGIGGKVIDQVVKFAKKDLKIDGLYSRHLSRNTAAKILLDSFGFINDGEAYYDKNDLLWQNVYMRII
jgi:RimJ/RimL family protein N-acetyltransferase